MTAMPRPPFDEGDVFLIGRKTATRMSRGALVALFFGLVCLIALVVGLVGGDSIPVAGVVVFLILGLVFTGFGATLLIATAQTLTRARRFGPHALLIDNAGFHERGTSHGEVFVPWSEFAGLELAANDAASSGYNPYRVPQRPNSPVSLGLLTVVRMQPTHPAEFAHRAPLFTTAQASKLDKSLVGGPFGRVYYTESQIRDDLIASIRRRTNGRLGTATDETRRAQFRGSQY